MTTRQIDHAVCPFCGCLCDDLRLTVSSGRITRAENACALALAGYAAFPRAAQPAALIDGRTAALDEAVEAAAQLLARARFPLVYGLSGLTVEAQRQAVRLADLLGACLDTAAAEAHGAAALALQQHGANGATLGEIRNHADLVLFWGADPLTTHPRHLERFSRPPNDRRGRTVIVLDHARTATAAEADLFIQIEPGRDFEVLSALRALWRGRPEGEGPRLAAAAGLPLETLRDLAECLQGCRYGAVFYGPKLGAGRAGVQTVGALLALVADLNERLPFAAQGLGGHANALGAENVLAWQTGYPLAVSFGRGYPRYGPGEFSAAEVLARGEADAALLIGLDPALTLPSAAVEHLRRLPAVALGTEAPRWAPWARVVVSTAQPGVEAGGTYFRLDEVALNLRPALDAPVPDAADVLRALGDRAAELCAARRAAWAARLAPLAGGQGG